MFNLDEIYSVSNFLGLCRRSVEGNIPHCWVQGEISNLSRPSSGHWYFSLKDERGAIRCALFRLNQRKLKFLLENGMSVVLRGAPTVYEVRGDFQMVVQQIEVAGIGNLQLAFDQLKSKLREEGLFNAEHKKPLPTSVKSIAVVSSANGAVIHDIINVLNKRYPFANISLYDTLVQGDDAHHQIIKALRTAEADKHSEVIILARGGGSMEDLWAFNKESLAREIFACKKPIVSAIGHETDTTIADFVADVRAPTPSAAAVLVTPDKNELINRLQKLKQNIVGAIDQALERNQWLLQQLQFRIVNPSQELQSKAQRLDEVEARLTRAINTLKTLNQAKLKTLNTELHQHSPARFITYKIEQSKFAQERLLKAGASCSGLFKSELKHLNIQLHQNMAHSFAEHSSKLGNQAKSLHILSPLSTLSRGYSITHNEENFIVHDTNEINVGDIIRTTLRQGKLLSKVYDKKD
ncbi:MAG: exodeoxyribonuclease VII large subunit [Gammaproteobacteria bacterium]|nr:exodeoxyribonuclease VII large subunit [Gammaproteobacteria bacterium]